MRKQNYSGSVHENRVRLQSEINSFPLVIDRTVLKKTVEEKELLKLFKKEYKGRLN